MRSWGSNRATLWVLKLHPAERFRSQEKHPQTHQNFHPKLAKKFAKFFTNFHQLFFTRNAPLTAKKIKKKFKKKWENFCKKFAKKVHEVDTKKFRNFPKKNWRKFQFFFAHDTLFFCVLWAPFHIKDDAVKSTAKMKRYSASSETLKTVSASLRSKSGIFRWEPRKKILKQRQNFAKNFLLRSLSEIFKDRVREVLGPGSHDATPQLVCSKWHTSANFKGARCCVESRTRRGRFSWIKTATRSLRLATRPLYRVDLSNNFECVQHQPRPKKKQTRMSAGLSPLTRKLCSAFWKKVK